MAKKGKSVREALPTTLEISGKQFVLAQNPLDRKWAYIPADDYFARFSDLRCPHCKKRLHSKT